MNKSVIIAVAGALALAVAVRAEKPAGDQPKHRPMEMSLVGPKLVEKLNLTDAQKAQLKDLDAAFDKERDQVLASKKDELAKLEEQAKAAREAKDDAKLKDVRKQRMELLKPVGELRKQYMDKFTATLTADQQKSLDAAREEFKSRRGKGPDAPPPAK